jgi:hypothetical protein
VIASSSPRRERRRLIEEAFLHPMVLASLVVLVVNDHWGKARWPGLVTGKVSDIAGLVFFPVLLAGLLGLLFDGVCRVSRRGGDPAPVALVRWASLATAVGFTAVKSSPTVAAWYSDALGWIQWPVRAAVALVTGGGVPDHTAIVVRADPWDLLTLPAVLVALWAGGRSARPAHEVDGSGIEIHACRVPADVQPRPGVAVTS